MSFEEFAIRAKLSEASTPYHTFTFCAKGKKGGKKNLSGLVPVKSKLSGDLFFFWRQIRCSNHAVYLGGAMNVSGTFNEANPTAVHSK